MFGDLKFGYILYLY